MNNWISVYKESPEHGQIISSRKSGEEGYCDKCEWDSHTLTFRTYDNQRNRYIITIWKHDEWKPLDE